MNAEFLTLASGIRLAAGLAALALAGCGGGGGSRSPPPASVGVSGTVSFDRVPAVAGGGLDYAATEAAPARGVTVEILNGDGTAVLATTVTDAGGRYSVSIPPATPAFVRARARMERAGAPSWRFSVVDNTQADAEYVLDGPVFDSGGQAQVRNLRARSGWDGASYSAVRAAAPFAILDVVYAAMQTLLAVEPQADFPELVIHWSADNVPSAGPFDPASGAIGTSFFAPGLGIYLLGAADADTDEYDRHVIAHEWGHYVEHAFSRTDSIAGPHTLGDELDMRVAFGEGWGNAFSGIVTGDSVYRDTLGSGQSLDFSFDVEGEMPVNSGWYSEQSVQELLYDIYDPANEDPVALGFGPIYDVLRNAQRQTFALTSVFSFVAALKARYPQQAAALDNLVASFGIDAVEDDYASGESHAGQPDDPDVLPVYTPIIVNGGPVNICSTDAFSSPVTDSYNKLGSRRFLRFDAVADGDYMFTAVATPALGAADPDFRLHHAGQLLPGCLQPTDPCPGESAEIDREQFSWPLQAGEYVLEVYEWSNTNGHSDPQPPLGRTCFDVTVSQP